MAIRFPNDTMNEYALGFIIMIATSWHGIFQVCSGIAHDCSLKRERLQHLAVAFQNILQICKDPLHCTFN